ncbi:hypothetical protein [Stenotrophomonas oahuensis]|mgnify:CR=1 FL=1|uniref:Uncharacterized protein n=1 Tax=Stenotrophomonas oahuensis TaxID=3003271 RepID=A0ABY9YTY2_9GAMM|nr:hypothetical protein [Stenotrophomonas sp. A5586]WNH54332.1 hypothetical protein PDM29_08655 [Stenotrophomonas sp. A5586]
MNNGHLLLMLILPCIATVFRVVIFVRKGGKVRTSLWNCVLDQLKAVSLYGLLGSPLGVLPLVVIGVILKGELLHLWIVIPAMLFSFLFGALPAMATGAVIGALKPWLWGWGALVAGCVFGMLLTAQWVVAISLADELKDVMIFALAGGFAGLVCSGILFRRSGTAV